MIGQVARSLALAVVGLAIAAAAFGRALHNAVRLEPVEPVEESATLVEPAEAFAPEVELTAQAVQLAVENDPFREQRAPSPERYLLPGERRVRAAPTRDAPDIGPPEFRVIGIAQIGEGGYALIETEDNERRLVSVGESMAGYRLTSVDGNVATLAMAGELFPLRVPDAEMHPEPERRSRSRRGDDDDDNNNNRRGGGRGSDIQFSFSPGLDLGAGSAIGIWDDATEWRLTSGDPVARWTPAYTVTGGPQVVHWFEANVVRR